MRWQVSIRSKGDITMLGNEWYFLLRSSKKWFVNTITYFCQNEQVVQKSYPWQKILYTLFNLEGSINTTTCFNMGYYIYDVPPIKKNISFMFWDYHDRSELLMAPYGNLWVTQNFLQVISDLMQHQSHLEVCLGTILVLPIATLLVT